MAFLWIHVDDGLLVANSDKAMAILKEEISGQMTVGWDDEVSLLVGIQIWSTPGGF